MNLYAYAGNNPVAFTDPFGLCKKKAKEGTICIDFFIAAETKWAFRGDNRGHNRLAPPNTSRAQVYVDADGSVAPFVSKSCNPVFCQKPSSKNKVQSSVGHDGTITVTISLWNSAALGTAPDIDGVITIKHHDDGTVTTTGDVTAFPSNDVYIMRKGVWVPVKPGHDETDPTDLLDGGGRDTWEETNN